MPIAFWIWAISLASAVVLGLAAAYENKKTPPNKQAINILNTLAGLAIFLVFAFTLVGLWQAWSPWEVTIK